MSDQQGQPKGKEASSQKGSTPAPFPGYEPGHEPNIPKGVASFRAFDGRPTNQLQTPNDDGEVEDEEVTQDQRKEAAQWTAKASGSKLTCPKCNRAYKTKDSLCEHTKEVHGANPQVVYQLRPHVFCPITGCPFASGEGFAEQENLDRHMQWAHPW